MVYIIEQIQLFLEIVVSLNTMSHIVKQIPGLKTGKRIPMERTRVMVDEREINAQYERLTTFLPGIPCAFIVNADEPGFANYTDARPETVVVPADYPLGYISIPTDRHIKGSMLVAAIVAHGTSLKPLMIVPRFRIEQELSFWGYEVTKMIFKYHEHRFIPAQLFDEWVNKVLMPYYAGSESSRATPAGGC
jgi:hypothetical protein